jgi:hypothetical protein
MAEIQIATKIRAQFMFVEGADHIRQEWIGTKDFRLDKVAPKHIDEYPNEWKSYQSIKPRVDAGGTPLMEIPGIQPKDTVALSLKGIHNVEALANLDEYTAATLDAGNGLVWHRTAKLVLAAKANAPKEPMTLKKAA